MKRPKATDRALCLHEAAHAVAAEVLRPRSMIVVEMDYVPGTPDVHGIVYGDDTEAVCSWDMWSWDDLDMYVAIAAGRYGEEIEPNPEGVHWKADDLLLHRIWPRLRRKVRRRAKALVRDHELEIRRVAFALATKRVMTGAEIREAAWL